MGVANVPAAAGGGIKSVQRGSAGSAGNVTITDVDITKSFVNVFGTASSGTVAATGALSAATGNLAAKDDYIFTGNYNQNSFQNGTANQQMDRARIVQGARGVTMNITNLSGGTNNLVAAVVQGYLSNSTTLVVSGACRWEVVEFA